MRMRYRWINNDLHGKAKRRTKVQQPKGGMKVHPKALWKFTMALINLLIRSSMVDQKEKCEKIMGTMGNCRRGLTRVC